MDFAVLGPLDVRTDAGRVSVGGERQQRLLAALLLGAGRTVAADHLVHTLWDGDPPPTARHQIYNGVWQLRRALTGTGAVLHNDPPGYRLDIDTSRFDLRRFELGLAEGRRLAASGDPAGAARALRAALALWRGPALAGIGGDVLGREAARLNELRLAALEDCVEHELACGAGYGLAAELTALVAEYPTRERLVAALMLALYRGGRQAEALAAYRDVAARLRDDLGIDPGPLLRQRFEEVLRAADGIAANPAGGTRRRCLPPKPDALAGRAPVIHRMLTGDRPAMFVISGMAGVGKTALAVHVAYELGAEYPDAHLFLDLQGHSEQAPVNPADALGALLSQLGVPSNHVPQELAGRTSLWRTELAERRAIVVLDNAAGSAQLAPLLPGQSTTLVLVTSRATLGPLDGARQISLDPLEPGAAVDLLRHAVADRVDADPEAAADVANLCGRLPLALRLAAHRLHDRPMWSMAALADRLRAADPPPIGVTVEGRSAATAFSMSYRLLGESLQLLFRLLGLHPAGTFEAHAAAALADQPLATTRAMLDELVDVHLVLADAPGRYRLHDLLRDFAASLVTEDEYGDALTRLLDYYLHTTAAATAHTEKSSSRGRVDFGVATAEYQTFATAAEGIAWLDAEILTIAAVCELASRTGRHRHACLLPRAVWHYLYHKGHNGLGQRLYQQALPSANALGDQRLRAMTNTYLAASLFRLGQFAASLEYLSAALRDYGDLDDISGQTHTSANAVHVNIMLGRLTAARQYAEAAIAFGVRLDEPFLINFSGNALGLALRYLGEYRSALQIHRSCLAELRGPDQRFRFAVVLGELGRDHLRLGQARLALLLFTRALRIKKETGNGPGGAETQSDRGMALAALGRLDEALPEHVAALEWMRQLNDAAGIAMVANDLGQTLTALGRFDDAVAAHRETLELSQRLGMRYQLARAHAGIAAATAHHDRALAREHWQRAYDLFAEMGTPEADDVARHLQN